MEQEENRSIRVLVVDDSALVRSILEAGLNKDPDIEVVGTASDPYKARDKILELEPDVLTLDVEMPRMDGVAFLRRLMPQYPIPVIMVSALTERGKKITMDALEAGALDFVTKPSTGVSRGLNEMMVDLQQKIKVAFSADVSHWLNSNKTPIRIQPAPRVLSGTTDKVIAIGASTGGTEAIRTMIKMFPASTPGIAIVQHMPPGFIGAFAQSLDQQSAMNVKEAENGDRIMQGRVLIAPGGMQMRVYRSGGVYQVKVYEGDKVNGHCPSVEVLMNSVSEHVGENAIGVMLTGMGGDGARGLLAMRRAGSRTFAQDEKTSVVFGMPKVAYDLGAVEKLLPIDGIVPAILKSMTNKAD
ncbi:MAG: chemotaxis response regulator protein-glutamate methylesterase [Proteobacteria bacterium]|nr:chemotaxis response regulator protein-glutamate methylesterase [Pseudomonadota bacterium]